MKSTIPADSTPRSAISAPRNTRIATPSELSKPPPKTVHHQGRTPDRRPIFARRNTVVREAEEVEGLRASLPSGGSRLGGEPPELRQPGLAPLERQAQLQHPVFAIHQR